MPGTNMALRVFSLTLPILASCSSTTPLVRIPEAVSTESTAALTASAPTEQSSATVECSFSSLSELCRTWIESHHKDNPSRPEDCGKQERAASDEWQLVELRMGSSTDSLEGWEGITHGEFLIAPDSDYSYEWRLLVAERDGLFYPITEAHEQWDGPNVTSDEIKVNFEGERLFIIHHESDGGADSGGSSESVEIFSPRRLVYFSLGSSYSAFDPSGTEEFSREVVEGYELKENGVILGKRLQMTNLEPRMVEVQGETFVEFENSEHCRVQFAGQ